MLLAVNILVSSINTSTKVLGITSGSVNGCLAHVGGTSCGHTLGERMGMCGGVFRERHHLGLYRQTNFSCNNFFNGFVISSNIVLGLY